MNETLELDLRMNNNKNMEKEYFQNNFINEKPEQICINNSFGDITLSDIGIKEKNSIPISQRSHYNITENEEIRGSIGSVKFEDFHHIFFGKNKKLKLTKEELNNIPLPIFSCIYCSNEKISFNHFLNQNISNKYLLLTSIYDIKDLNRILSYPYLIDKDDKNDRFEDMIIKNTEYLNNYYNYENFKNIIKLKADEKNLFEMHQKKYIRHMSNLLNNLKLKKIKKNLKKIPLHQFKKNYTFNNNNLNFINNSSIINSIDGIGEINKKTIQNNINQTISNLSASNFNSVSLINFIENNNQKEKENKFKLDDIIEQIEKNSEQNSDTNYFDFQKLRKIKREDIEWENEYYNIWNPKIEPIVSQYTPVISKKNFSKINKTFMNNKKENMTFYKKNCTNAKKKLSMVPFRENNYFKSNKSYQNNNGSKNKSKEVSYDNNNALKKHKINHLIAYSSSKNNKNKLIINLNNNSPSLKNGGISNIISIFSKKNNSHKNLNKLSSNISLNLKKNMNPINLFNSKNKVFKLKNHMKNRIPLNISIVNKSSKFKKKEKDKINFGKNVHKNKNSQKFLSNKKINNSKLFSHNSSNSNKKKAKKIDIINSLPKKINRIKNKHINMTNKITRNNTYQNLEIIKEKFITTNLNNESFEPKIVLSNKKLKCETKKIFVVKSKNNLKNNQNGKEKFNNIHIKNANEITKLKINNDIGNKNIIYDIKIFLKKNKNKIFDKNKKY